MGSASIKMYKETNELLEKYASNRTGYVLIHYARQNCFSEIYEKGPRVVSIVVMNMGNEQMLTFSLLKSSENYGVDFFSLTDEEKDNVEYKMLESFYECVERNKDKTWLHWNMKNNNFGFYAINERYKCLGGTPFAFDDAKLVNISDLLKRKYGPNFARDCQWKGEEVGKMYDIFSLNKITDAKILGGEAEIKEYILKNLLSVEQSVLAKIKALKIIVEKLVNNVLVTRGSVLKDVYGIGVNSIARYIQDNATLAILSSVFGGIVANIICKLLGI